MSSSKKKIEISVDSPSCNQRNTAPNDLQLSGSKISITENQKVREAVSRKDTLKIDAFNQTDEGSKTVS